LAAAIALTAERSVKTRKNIGWPSVKSVTISLLGDRPDAEIAAGEHDLVLMGGVDRVVDALVRDWPAGSGSGGLGRGRLRARASTGRDRADWNRP
jgi:hypothetical protein